MTRKLFQQKSPPFEVTVSREQSTKTAPAGSSPVGRSFYWNQAKFMEISLMRVLF